MKKDCSACAHRSTGCAQGLMTLPLKDLLAWCKEAKKKAGVTNVKLSELTDIPIGTIERIMAGKIEDAKFSTIQPLVVVLISLLPEGYTCLTDPSKDAAEREKLERHIAGLRADHAAELAALHEDTQRRVNYLKGEIAARDATIEKSEKRSTRLLRALIALGAFDILILTYDFLHPTIGFLQY